jgi:CDP-4-dehydro-6-deoxyglucose reductase
MPTVDCDGVRVALAAGETVLEGLLRAGVAVPHGCRAGACRACLVRATGGTPPRRAQADLQEALRGQGYFLACSATPTEDLSVSLTAAAALDIPAHISSIDLLSRDVVRVRLLPEHPLPYRAGQFVTLARPDGLARSYSLASLPLDGPALELHVRRLPGGRMSTWLADPATVGARVALRGPSGSCCYPRGEAAAQPLVLVGTGTGLAPLWGVLRDALDAGHHGPITLLHGARTGAGLYLVDELLALAARHPSFTYRRCVLTAEEDGGVEVGAIDRVLLGHFPSLGGHRVFLCGDAELVLPLRRKVFLAGASLAEIHADAFINAPPPAA